MTDEEKVEQLILGAGEHIFNLFKEARGRPPRSRQELLEWVGSAECTEWMALDPPL